MSVLYLLYYILQLIIDIIDTLWDMIIEVPFIERWRVRRRQLKEREDKIKRGFIRITESDPYGEEDWS